jgi:hypothetical protein
MSNLAVPREMKLSDGPIPLISPLDLSSSGVIRHFAQSTRNVALLNFLVRMDEVDRWAVDYNELSSPKAIEIGAYVDQVRQFVEEFGDVVDRLPEPFTEVLAHLTTSRCLVLLRAMSQRNPAFLHRLTELIDVPSGASLAAKTVQRRIVAAYKAELLSEIWSNGRLELINRIMRSYRDA